MRSEPGVLAILGTWSACELYRVILPFSALKARGYEVGWTTKDEFPRLDLSDWDIFVLPRLALESPETRDEFFRLVRQHDKLVVYELDDDLLHIPESNPVHLTSERVTTIVDMLGRSDLVTVPNRTLAEVVRPYNSNVHVLPTGIDPSLWRYPKSRLRQIDGLTVGVLGGESHYDDWRILAEVFPRLAERYPKLRFVVGGYMPDYLQGLGLGDRLISLPWLPMEQYPAMVAQVDIGLCPLSDAPFNQSKSPVKYYEYAMLETPIVASPTVYGEVVKHGRTGFLAQGPEEWIRWVGRLVDQPEKRRAMGATARGNVVRSADIHDLASRWGQVYRAAWLKRARTRA